MAATIAGDGGGGGPPTLARGLELLHQCGAELHLDLRPARPDVVEGQRARPPPRLVGAGLQRGRERRRRAPWVRARAAMPAIVSERSIAGPPSRAVQCSGRTTAGAT